MWQPPLCIPSEKPWVFQNGKGAETLHEPQRPERQLQQRLDCKLQIAHVQRVHAEGDFTCDVGRDIANERSGSPNNCTP